MEKLKSREDFFRNHDRSVDLIGCCVSVFASKYRLSLCPSLPSRSDKPPLHQWHVELRKNSFPLCGLFSLVVETSWLTFCLWGNNEGQRGACANVASFPMIAAVQSRLSRSVEGTCHTFFFLYRIFFLLLSVSSALWPPAKCRLHSKTPTPQQTIASYVPSYHIYIYICYLLQSSSSWLLPMNRLNERTNGLYPSSIYSHRDRERQREKVMFKRSTNCSGIVWPLEWRQWPQWLIFAAISWFATQLWTQNYG